MEVLAKSQIFQSGHEQHTPCSAFEHKRETWPFFATTNLLQYEGGRRPVSPQQNDSVESIPFWRACKPSTSPKESQQRERKASPLPNLLEDTQPVFA
jgi:hypothetical protein